MAIGALDAEALHDVVVRARGTSLPRAALRRVHEVSGGNPFFAIELARSLEAHRDHELGALLPIPTSLRDLVRNRLAALPGDADMLALVAALPQATATLVRSLGGPGADAGIEAAVDAGVLRREGDRLRFTHPLLASAAYAEMSPPQRRALHRRLADAARTRSSAGITSRTPPRPRTHASPGSSTTLSPPRSTGARCRPRPISERTHGGSRPRTTPPKLVVAPSRRRSAATCSASPIARARSWTRS